MAEHESVFRSYVQCINLGRWRDLPDVVSFPLRFNGDLLTTPEAFAAHGSGKGRIRLRTDAFTVDNNTGRLAATSIVELSPKNYPEKKVQFMKQSIVWVEGGKIWRIITTGTPEDEVERQLFSPDYAWTPDLISTYSNGHYKPSRKLVASQALENIYRNYIACINARTMQSELAKYCQPHVTHNTKRLSLDEYRLLIQEAIAAIPDINFGIETLLIDERTQRAAVRIEFTGTPTGELSGVQPTGRSVRFYEYVTYFFQDGKIDRVWSIVDWDSYREQLSQSVSNGTTKA